jgi:rhamnulokinase
MSHRFHLAIDLGAGSGRAILGQFGAEGLVQREVHRFQYPPRRADGHLRWDLAAILGGVEEGLRRGYAAASEHRGTLVSVGVDSWAVDYGLVDAANRLLEDPICYRDERTVGTPEAVFARVPRDEVFAITGIQVLPFNTLYQLFAHARAGLPSGARRLLMIPDLCHLHLTGLAGGEYTNATSTQLLDARSRTWADALFERLDLPRMLMPELVVPGAPLGTLAPEVQERLGVPVLRVIAPATHDTGSAVAGTPLRPGWAYISSGTWSLVGVELGAPLLNPAAARANFTNEGGAGGTIRFLKNVMGLWILESCRKEWGEAGRDHERLMDAVVRRGPAGVVFPDDPRFFNPPSMTTAIQEALRESGQAKSSDEVTLARVILDSLALRYASVLRQIEDLTGHPLRGVHIVGGGSQNAYLNQATADAWGKPVVAGPAEATAAGNLLVQALADGAFGSLAEGRDQIARGAALRAFEPRDLASWRASADAYAAIEGRYSGGW